MTSFQVNVVVRCKEVTHSLSVHAGTAEPFRVSPPEAVAYPLELSPILYDTLVHLDLMPYRELTTPAALKAALQGGDRLLIDATERAYHRSQDDAKQREHYSGKKNSIR